MEFKYNTYSETTLENFSGELDITKVITLCQGNCFVERLPFNKIPDSEYGIDFSITMYLHFST